MQRNSADKWPSTSIGKGGVFHRHGVEYSQETHDLIKCKNLYHSVEKLFNVV